ncbi:ATP-dependent metallopeptidase FtsH/Yme1/Tma family protein [Clostridium sp. AF32-7AC]|nr:ATP-dependent metallopeptidase FtsH/Yme1/Tma family protein [Clostridium sp.]RHO89908.1 ATP-dependent metallopeptidase FtsH/Yme1/Tma family protein [Clostridium sp. AF37-7]RHP39266.1 ATP-dependent metallopeptidase FtsH/Yme1/Tma family protein [Clostridium sp. AF32-7AC]RHQ16077.1 ATP-dependent metallopeptidase FtsH/Yme1/Tma family protein [Clostridium sp. AM48-13]RHQ25972.1 ATP-dependent metallopeptidase FtsH/Yme1/Tma family protein [Clostridium sp. AF27-5AA]RHQ64738.1 ATP-dependent metallop
MGLLILMLLVIMFFSLKVPGMATERELSYPEFMVYLENKTVESAQIRPNREVPTGEVVFETTSGDREEFNVLDVKEVEMALRKAGVPYTTTSVRQDSYFMTVILPIALSAGVLIFLFMFINSRSGGGANAKMMNFGRSRARMVSTSKVNFTKVAGLEEEKEELEEIVDFLKNPQKYTGVGARIPKGVILVGPPGTGKTLLAKAVAGEAGVPFFSISGSDFVEMFVGVGASRVRDLFEEAKKNAPCIVFIDEIDAVARQRGTGMGGGHDEREQTLNQLLVEMDGFGVNEGIIVMAATNRVDILDPAILRPGRFDRKVAVGRPDVKGREEILGVHTKEKPLGEDVDLHRIAQTTAGFTGADLENLMNEAAINTAKEGRKFLTQTDIEKAFIKVGIGAEKRSKVISEKDKKITAYHEAGHAILFHVLPDVGPVHTVSIIPTGVGAAGYTMPLPEQDELHMTKGRMLQNIMVSLGGRIAEEIIFDDITTGASQDIKQATSMARAMVTEYGMSEKLGMINYGGDNNEVFIGRDLAHTRTYSEEVASEIDSEVKRIIDECYAKAKRIILDHEDVLHSCCALLMEKEKIGQAEFEALFQDGEKPSGEVETPVIEA